ncbi:uncharacterized protein [Montipora capricornis]|uniref:uncharacterized protein n=1 Tax=Montipora capricornis TaxID=246305 RepID=UPI0035F15CCD
MISAIQEHARKPPLPVDAPMVEMTCNYLEACHLIFEKGILSHMTISPKYQRVLENIKEGFCFFKDWSTCHQNTEYPDNSKKARQSKFLAWQTWDLLRLMVYGFLDFSEWFLTAYPNNYFISPLRINGSAIESIFSVLKFSAGGNLSASNYGSFRGRVITGREVITSSNSERGYRDDVILISGSITSRIAESGTSYSVQLVYDPCGIQEMKQFCLSANLSQSSIGGRQGSNACTIIASLVGYHFVKLDLPELTLSTLPSQWFDVLVDSMLAGNALHDLLFDREARNLDIEDAVESCGNDLHIASYDQPIGFDLRSGDLSPVVQTIQAQATHHQRQAAVLISGFKSVALLIWETGAFAIFDSHMHAQFGAIMSYAPPGPTSSTGIASWLSKMVQKYFNGSLGLCTLTFVTYSCT